MAERRRLLNYLLREDEQAHQAIVKDLKIKVVVAEKTKEEKIAEAKADKASAQEDGDKEAAESKK